MAAVSVGMLTEQGGHRITVSLDGNRVVLPPIEHLPFYVGLAVLAAFDVVEWPLALLLMGGHALLDATNRPGLHELGAAIEVA